jgi:hypothetical protein
MHLLNLHYIQVEHVQKPNKDSLYIEHIGKFEDGGSESFSDQSVEIVVDEDKRRLHARSVARTICHIILV